MGFLASSRGARGVAGEVAYRVPSLGLPDLQHLPPVESMSQYEAVRLFIDRAVAAVPGFQVTNENAPAVAQICHRLDGIPLAIELASAKVRALTVEQIAARIDDRFRLLTGGSRTALPRQQTLRAAIDWSYSLLSEPERILFRRLAVFVGGWTLEAAEAVCGDDAAPPTLDRRDVFDLLARLGDKSLVITTERGGQARYRRLETIRQYAREKLLESEESEAMRNRHLAYLLQLAEAAEPHLRRAEQVEWLRSLDPEIENFRAALEWALSKPSPEEVHRLAAALGRYWSLRGHWLEGAKWLTAALKWTAAEETQTERAARARALYTDAMMADLLDDLDRIRSSAEASLALCQAVGDAWGTAFARAYAEIGRASCRERV